MKHLACIMDGNRRFAKKNKWEIVAGHKSGLEATKTVIDFCLEQAIPYLSLYTLSIENLNRSSAELAALFAMVEKEGERFLQENEYKSVRIQFIGDRSLFPVSLISLIERIEQATKNGDKLAVQLLFCYGARQEMVSAVQRLINDMHPTFTPAQKITPELLERYLWTNEFPAPDLILRTGGVKRLSNFLLYQAAYAELYFLDCLWPEITQVHLADALTCFEQTPRNGGL